MRRLPAALWTAIGAGGVLLALLPLPEWTGAPDRGPIWTPHVEAWLIGTIVVVVLAVIMGRGVATLGVRLPRVRLSDRALVGGAALLLTLAAVAVCHLVFAANPHLVDEMAQLLHAKAFAAGRLALPPPAPPEAFLITHTWVTDAGWISQYPPGQTVLFALGLLAGVPWLVNPLLGGAGAVGVYFAARGLYGRGTARAAAVLWAVSPWVLFMSASYLNHVGAVTFGLAAWALVWGPRERRPWHYVLAGLAIGVATVTRPLDGVAAAAPILVWMTLERRWRGAPWVVLGGLPIAVLWGYVNWRLHGHPLTLGYSVLYDAEHGMGFHMDPWGQPFTPWVALSNLGVALKRLNIYLYEWPIPALLPLAVWAVAARRRRRSDVVLAVALLAAPALYFFYWHSGFFLGPRFYYAIAPALVIATARAWRWGWAVARRAPRRWADWRATLAGGALIVIVWGWAGILPSRIEVYREGLATLKLHPEERLRERGVRQAVVLVRESWGSRIITGLWGLGVPPGLVERAYRRVDACRLDELVRDARADGMSSDEVAGRLEQALAEALARPDTLPVVDRWPDPTLRLDPTQPLSAHCREEMRRDLAGFTLFGNLAWRNPIGLDRGIVFARDLFERNDELLASYAGWEVWRYAPPAGDPGSRPVLTRVRPGAP